MEIEKIKKCIGFNYITLKNEVNRNGETLEDIIYIEKIKSVYGNRTIGFHVWTKKYVYISHEIEPDVGMSPDFEFSSCLRNPDPINEIEEVVFP